MGPAWFGKIYNKLETLLVEVDTFTSQSTLCLNSSDPSEWESVRGEPTDESAEDPSSDLQKQHHDRLSLPSCDSPSDPPSHQNFDVSGNVGVEEQVEEEITNDDLSSSSSSSSDEETLSGAPLLLEYCGDNLTSATTHEKSHISNTLTTWKVSAEEASVFPGSECVEEVKVESFRDYSSTESQSTQSSVESFGAVVERNDHHQDTLGISVVASCPNPTDTEISDVPVEDNVANMIYNPDDVIHEKSDAAPLNTKELSSMAFQEGPSYVDDNELYALHVRTKKLRSVKRKILDALTTKRLREKEYEQLAIWFGDADMCSDLAREDSEHKEAIDSSKSEDSQWELL